MKSKEITKSLNRKKSAISSCMPVSILIDSTDIYLPLLKDIINDSLKTCIFPDELKLAEVIKKADPFDKTNYRPVIKSNHLINKLQERALRAIYNDYGSSFSELLEVSNKSTIHIKNMKVLMTEIHTFLNDLSPPIMNDIFQKQENYYSLRNPRSLVSKQKFTATCGNDTILLRGPQIWQDLPQDIKNSDSLNLFKSNIKKYGTLACHCKLCRSLIPCVGYID